MKKLSSIIALLFAMLTVAQAQELQKIFRVNVLTTPGVEYEFPVSKNWCLNTNLGTEITWGADKNSILNNKDGGTKVSFFPYVYGSRAKILQQSQTHRKKKTCAL